MSNRSPFQTSSVVPEDACGLEVVTRTQSADTEDPSTHGEVVNDPLPPPALGKSPGRDRHPPPHIFGSGSGRVNSKKKKKKQNKIHPDFDSTNAPSPSPPTTNNEFKPPEATATAVTATGTVPPPTAVHHITAHAGGSHVTFNTTQLDNYVLSSSPHPKTVPPPWPSLARSSSVFDQLHPRRQKQRAAWKVKLGDFLDGIPFTIISIMFTIAILYCDLIRLAATSSSADPYFLAWTIFAMTFFTAEIVLSSFARAGYWFNFYFWMDLVAMVSLLCNIPGFMDAITGNSDDSNRHVTLDRAAKATQAAARAARIMQVIALVQLLRYKARRLALKKASSRRRVLTEDSISSFDSEFPSPSGRSPTLAISKPQTRLGERVTEMTMRKVIVGVLILLLVLPVFDSSVYYGHPPFVEDGGLVMLHDLYLSEGNTTSFQINLQAYIEENVYKLGTKHTGYIYRLVIANVTWVDSDPNLRKIERQTAKTSTPQCDNGPWDECLESKAWLNVRWAVQMQALLDIGRITFILSMLSVGALLFIRDTDHLVLQPIERMLDQVKSVSENPLAAAANATTNAKSSTKQRRNSGSNKQMETRILEHSITKICSLLSVGFGEAGAEVIADNIRSGGDLNPMIPGRKVRAIFGFCDIRSFTDATEVLQEEVMEFVNSIANIVHTEVSLHGGAANKNIGDAFLLVWKLPGSAGMTQDRSSRSSVLGAKAAALDSPPSDDATVTHLADAALASFIITQAALKRSKQLQGYSAREDLNARMPNFCVKMGFGLHVGWAIEGAIGSRHKIDASYLSPHVNMAARLEAATKQFGVPLLLSEVFVALLSPAVKERVRQIDCVTVKGSTHPIGLYTYDCEPERVAITPPPADPIHGYPTPASPTSPAPLAPDGPHKADHFTYSDYPYFDEFEEHPDIVSTRMIDDGFLPRFKQGFNAYKGGDWRLAASIFEETRVMRRNYHGEVVVDGPSDVLLAVIREKHGEAPPGWAGYRELTEK